MKNTLYLLIMATSINLFAAENLWDSTVFEKAKEITEQENRIHIIKELKRLQNVFSELSETNKDFLYHRASIHGHLPSFCDALRTKFFSELLTRDLSKQVKIIQIVLRDNSIEKTHIRFAQTTTRVNQFSARVFRIGEEGNEWSQNIDAESSLLQSPDNTSPFKPRRDALVPSPTQPTVPTITISEADLQ